MLAPSWVGGVRFALVCSLVRWPYFDVCASVTTWVSHPFLIKTDTTASAAAAMAARIGMYNQFF
jgi:hypothetical protein